MTTAARLTFLVAMLLPIAAWGQRVDVSNDAVRCSTVYGVTSIDPPLAVGGTAGATVMRVKAYVGGCTVTGPHAVSALSGRISGKVIAPSNECVTLQQPLTGSLTIKWKTDKTTPIVPSSSTMTITDVAFGFYASPWGVGYGQFSLGFGEVTGAFTGGDGGAASSNVSITSQSLDEIGAKCLAPAGLKKLAIGLGQLTLE